MSTSIKRLGIEKLKERLKTYPGAHSGENWKLETDLTKCTEREKEELGRYGLVVEDLAALGFNRGEVAHMLFGYKHTRSDA